MERELEPAGHRSISRVDVSATLGTAIGSLRATAGSGDVSLHVPGGAYRVTASTGSGDRSLDGIEERSSSTRSIQARTGSGDVSIDGTDG